MAIHRRILVGALVTLLVGVLGVGTGASASEPVELGAPIREATAVVALDCVYTSPEVFLPAPGRTVTVTAEMPSVVPAGRAFAVTVDSDLPTGSLDLQLTNATHSEVSTAGGSGPSTTVVVATGHAGDLVRLAVGGVQVLHFDLPLPGTFVTERCTPTGSGFVAQSRTVGGGPATAAEAGSSMALYLACGARGVFPVDAQEIRLTTTIPTSLVSGQTYQTPVVTSSTGFLTVVALDQPGGSFDLPADPEPFTVTAPPGSVVSLRLRFVIFGGTIVLSCGPLGSGYLASIPVVAP